MVSFFLRCLGVPVRSLARSLYYSYILSHAYTVVLRMCLASALVEPRLLQLSCDENARFEAKIAQIFLAGLRPAPRWGWPPQAPPTHLWTHLPVTLGTPSRPRACSAWLSARRARASSLARRAAILHEPWDLSALVRSDSYIPRPTVASGSAPDGASRPPPPGTLAG